MKITQNLCPESRYSIKCPYTRTPTRVVIHNTGNDAAAANEISYMINRSEEVSFHYAVDDEGAVQGLPEDRNAWASGDGHGKGNMEGIHIEICYSLSGGDKFTKAEQNAAELTAQILMNYGWGIEQVTKHQDYDGKYCPHRTLDLGWQRFLSMVKEHMEDDDNMTQEQFNSMMEAWIEAQKKKSASGWAKEALETAKADGVMVGDENGNQMPKAFATREEIAQMYVNAKKALKAE